MGQQYARADQPVIGRVEQRDRDLVRGIVPDPSDQVVQTKIRIDHARRGCAIGHVVVALVGRIRAGTIGNLDRPSSNHGLAFARLSLASLLLTHDQTLVP